MNTEIIAFPTPQSWAEWLAENHARDEGIWIRLFKKGSGIPSVTYQEALDEALCYGWIDGQKKAGDDTCWLQRFLPRRPRSVWSKINCGHVERLIALGKMQPSGLKAVEEAKADGRWDAAYDSASTATVPEDFQRALDDNDAARAFFERIDRTNRYAILYRLQSAKKPETRAKRIETFIDMLARGEKIHP